MATKATSKPLVRILDSKYEGPLVVELTTDLITIRKFGSRRGGPTEVQITAGLLYQRLAMQKGKD